MEKTKAFRGRWRTRGLILGFSGKEQPGVEGAEVDPAHTVTAPFEGFRKPAVELGYSPPERWKRTQKADLHSVLSTGFAGLLTLKRRIISPRRPMDMNWNPASIRSTPKRSRGLLPMASPENHRKDR